MRVRIFVLCAVVLVYGCVGTRKYKQLASEKETLEKKYKQETQDLSDTNAALAASEQHLRDELITQNTLLSSLLADKLNLEKEISSLQSTINQLSNESESTQALLNQELQKKNASLQRKEELLNQLVDQFTSQQKVLTEISGSLSDRLAAFSAEQIEWFLVDRQLNIVLYNSLLFTSRNQLQNNAIAALDQISDLIKNHPSLQVVVEGHTDNSPDRAERALESTVDNATRIARYLLDPGGINTNQIQVAGRGGYAPRVSNQTPAGQQMNNRVEIQFHAPVNEIFAIIRDQKD